MGRSSFIILLVVQFIITTANAADSLKIWNEESRELHEQRRLLEASLLYEKIMRADPPVLADAAMRQLAVHFTPRIYTTPSEYFPLEDIVAVIHPQKPFIAYHLFWDDDIDFPEDNDPTDHEVVWIEYDKKSMKVVDVITYFHGRRLNSKDAVKEANANEGRARINVEWGKHGSVPYCAAPESCKKIYAMLKDHWQKLHTIGIRRPNHYFARNWPHKFAGNFSDYVDFSRFIDPVSMLKSRNTIVTTKWANAVLDQYFIPYNFYPKTEWPWQ